MFDLPPGFWEEEPDGPPGAPGRNDPPRSEPAGRAAAPAAAAATATAPATAADPDSPLALVQELFPGRILSIDRPEDAAAAPDAEEAFLEADEPDDD